MTAFRFSIAELLWAVAIVGVWFASLRLASTVWTTLAATLTLMVLLAAVMAAVYRRGSARAYWVGFAFFGWVYLLLVSWDWVGGQFGHDLTHGLTDLAEWLLPSDPRILASPFPTTPVQPGAPGGAAGGRPFPVMPSYETLQQRSIRLGNFVEIGRMSLSLLFAVVGGHIALKLAERSDPNRNS